MYKTYIDLKFDNEVFRSLASLKKEAGGEYTENYDAACHWVKANLNKIENLIPNCPDH